MNLQQRYQTRHSTCQGLGNDLADSVRQNTDDKPGSDPAQSEDDGADEHSDWDDDYVEGRTVSMANNEPKMSFAKSSQSNKKRGTGIKMLEASSNSGQEGLSVSGMARNSRQQRKKETKLSIKEGRKRANAKYRSLKERVEELSEIIKSKDSSIRDVERKLKAKEDALFAVQAENHAHIGVQEKLLYPDDETRRLLMTVIKPWGQFARTWALQSFSDTKDEELKSLHNYLALDIPVIASPRIFNAMRDGSLPPSVVLHAIIARHICSSTFEKPLDFLASLCVQGEHGRPVEFLNSIYEWGCKRQWIP